MPGYLIIRDGLDGNLEFRSRGGHGQKTGGDWKPVNGKTTPIDAARWTSAATAEKAVEILNAAEPDRPAWAMEIKATRVRAEAAGDNGASPATAKTTKAPAATGRRGAKEKAAKPKAFKAKHVPAQTPREIAEAEKAQAVA